MKKDLFSETKKATVSELTPEAKKIFSRNLSELIKSKKISKKDLADQIGISASSLHDYMNEEKSSSLPNIAILLALKNQYGINMDDFLTKETNIDDYNRSSDPSQEEIESKKTYKKFEGVYIAYYLDTSFYKGRDISSPEESLTYGIIAIVETTSSVSTSTYETIAIMGLSTKEEAKKVKNTIESLTTTKNIINYVSESYPTKLYTGDFEIAERFAYLSMKHGTSDRALAIFHCPITNKDKYIGGIGTINSVSKGREKLPTVQFIGISREVLSNSEEEIHRNLLLSYPNFKADKYAPALVKTFKSLYVSPSSDEYEKSDTQKLITIKSNMEMYIKDSLECNLFRYAKISERDDDEFYKWLTFNPDDEIDSNLI